MAAYIYQPVFSVLLLLLPLIWRFCSTSSIIYIIISNDINYTNTVSIFTISLLAFTYNDKLWYNDKPFFQYWRYFRNNCYNLYTVVNNLRVIYNPSLFMITMFLYTINYCIYHSLIAMIVYIFSSITIDNYACVFYTLIMLLWIV